jgi:hypothetical protein
LPIFRLLSPCDSEEAKKATSRLDADLHAKLLEKLETYPLLQRVPAENPQ